MANTADQDIVFTGSLKRGRNVDNANSGSAVERGHGLVARNRGGELSVNGHGMSGQDRYAHAGSANQKIRDVQDTTRFVAELLLFIGFKAAIIDDRTGQGHNIESNGGDVDLRLTEINGVAIGGQALEVLIDGAANLIEELANTLESRTRHGLVRGHRQTLDTASSLRKRLNCRHDSHGRAVRVGNDALGAIGDVCTVDLGDDQRDLGVLAPCGGVVDDYGSGLGKLRRILARGRGTRGEDRDVDPGEVSGRNVFNDDLCALPRERRTRRTSGGKETNRFNREVSLFQDRAHHATNLARRTDNSNRQTSHFQPLFV